MSVAALYPKKNLSSAECKDAIMHRTSWHEMARISSSTEKSFLEIIWTYASAVFFSS